MRGLVLLATLALAAPAIAAAQPGIRGSAPMARDVERTIAVVRPGNVRLGERVRYQGWVIAPDGMSVRWVPPAAGGAWTWGPLRAWKTDGVAGSVGGRSATSDTFHVEVGLQAFETGILTVPGMAYQFAAPRAGTRGTGRLPAVQLAVLPVIAVTDTNPQLRPLRGPLAAPWWERVPWLWVAVGLLALLLLVLLWRRLARRRSAAAPTLAPALAIDPVQRALAELHTLRGLNLPEQQRYGEHAFHLTRIARGFLTAVAAGIRPGDTTPELVARLPGAGLGGGDADRLAALMRAWDLVKFARAASSLGEARAAETGLEDLVRRWGDAHGTTTSRVA